MQKELLGNMAKPPVYMEVRHSEKVRGATSHEIPGREIVLHAFFLAPSKTRSGQITHVVLATKPKDGNSLAGSVDIETKRFQPFNKRNPLLVELGQSGSILGLKIHAAQYSRLMSYDEFLEHLDLAGLQMTGRDKQKKMF